MQLYLEFYPQAIVLLFSRVAVLVVSVPFFAGTQVPMPMKMAVAFSMAVVLFSQISPEWLAMAGQITTVPQMFLAMLNEILIGAGMGMLCNLFIAACRLAGAMVAMDTGLAMAQAVDPVSGTSSMIPSQIMQSVGIMLVLILGGHLVLIKILVASLKMGASPLHWLNEDFISALLYAGRDMFEWGIRLALPVVCVSLLLNICLGMISRLAPDFDILFLSLPVRLGVGIAVFGFTLRYCGGVLERMIDAMLNRCGAVFAG